MSVLPGEWVGSRSRFPGNSLPSVRSVTSKVNLWESKGNPHPPIPNPPRCLEITGLNDIRDYEAHRFLGPFSSGGGGRVPLDSHESI